MIIIGVDPGEVTGIALWCDDTCESVHARSNPLRPDTAEVAAGTVGSVLRRMLSEHVDPGGRLITLERFVQGARKTRQPHALEASGQVGAVAADLGIKIVYQSPSPALKIAPNQLLRRIGWYVATRDQHANAAQRHIVLALATFYPDTFASIVGI